MRHRLSLIAIFSASALLAAALPAPVSFPDSRVNALGGPHVALLDDGSVLYSNPAGLSFVPETLSVVEIGATLSGPLFDIANLAQSAAGGSIFSKLSSVFDSKGRAYISADVGGPIAFGYVGGDFGFALSNRTHLLMNASSLTKISLSVTEDIALLCGYAFKFSFPGNVKLSFGMLPKAYIRGSIPIETDLLSIQSLFSDPTALLGKNFHVETGVGIDAGTALKLGDFFTLGLSCKDAFTPTFTNKYKSFTDFVTNPKNALLNAVPEFAITHPNLSLGIALTPSLGPLDVVFSSFKFMLDFSDILDLASLVPRNPILNASTGLEVTLLDVLSFRAGIREALLAAGFGLDLSIIELDVAMFGRELGSEPGRRPIYNLSVNLAMRL